MKETREEAIKRLCVFKASKLNDEIRAFNFELGVKWQKENSQSIVPFDAYDIEVFKIEADENGKLFAYVGYKITNGNFHFNIVPFTEPKHQQEQDKMLYSEEDMNKAIKFGAFGMYGYEIGEEGKEVNQIKRFLEQLRKEKAFENLCYEIKQNLK